MELNEQNGQKLVEQKIQHLLNLRVVFIVVAVIASIGLFFHPVFSWQDDRGIMYVRTFNMTNTEFTMTHTGVEDGIIHNISHLSVIGLLICNIAILATSLCCFVFFLTENKLIPITTITICLSGLYYALMIFYAMLIVDEYFVTIWPNFMALLPAVVIEMMVLIKRNVKILIEVETDGED